MHKQASSTGSALPDPAADAAAAESVPAPSVSNKPPPGQTGPKGMQPRQTYSRVNTGTPQTPEVGAISLKSMSPRGLEFLPKLSEARMNTTVTSRPTLNDMVKAAMAGAIDRVSITDEAVRQIGGTVKSASAELNVQSLPTDLLNKLADALGYVADQIEKGASIEISGGSTGGTGPGAGPGALQVTQSAVSGDSVLKPGQTGGKDEAGAPMESGKHGPAPTNAMGTNESMQHGSWPADVMNGKTAGDLASSNLERLSKVGAQQKEALLPLPNMQKVRGAIAAKGTLPNLGGGGAGGGIVSAVRKLAAEKLAEKKQAEDANNPAQISAGHTGGPVASGTASGEAVPSQPADVSAQERLIGSNEAAINFTKRDATRDPISDAGRVYASPVMKDPVLSQVFENSGKAGVKTSAANDAIKIAAARALLSKLAADANDKTKKSKESAMGGAGAPPPAGVPSPAFTQ